MGEPRHEAGAADALDRYWEHLVGGSAERPRTAAPNDADPDLAATVRRVHALPDAPGPAAAFVARLEEQLMSSLAREHAVAGSTGAAGAGNADAPDRWRMVSRSASPPTWRGGGWWWRWLNGLAAVGLALVMLAGLAVGWGQLPGRGGEPTRMPAIAEATPGAAVVDGAAMYLGNAARTGEVAGPGPNAKPERRGEVALGEGVGGGGHGPLLMVDGIAYMTGTAWNGAGGSESGAGFVWALDSTTGAERWRTKVLEPGSGEAGADIGFYLEATAVADGTVYVGTTVITFPEEGAQVDSRTEPEAEIEDERKRTSELVAFDAATGAERWRIAVDNEAIQPAVVDGVVYLGSGGDVVAFDAASGGERWRATVAPVARAGDGGTFVNPVAVGDGQVYAANNRGELHALDARTGVKRWRFAAGNVEWLDIPRVAEGMVYVADYRAEGNEEHFAASGRLHALDAVTGAERWVHEDDRDVGPLAVGGGSVFVLGDSDGDPRILALDAATGAERWSAESGDHATMFAMLSRGVLYFTIYDPGLIDLGPLTDLLGLGESTTIWAIDASTGERLWNVETDVQPGWTVVADGRMYLTEGGFDGAGTLVPYGAE